MENIVSKLKNNWILFIIILQPVLDIVSYFQMKYIGNSYSWIIRVALVAIVVFISFVASKDKKKFILKISPFALFFIIHMANLYRIHKISIIEDTKYFILVFQMPILCIALVDYIKNTDYDLNKIKLGICWSFTIFVISILVAYITKTYQYTYAEGIGITGWFSSANTASMILCALTPWVIYMASNSKKVLVYLITCMTGAIILFTNATRSCYFTLLGSLCVMIFALLVSKKETKKILKIIITIVFLILSVIFYKFSSTNDRRIIANNVTREYSKDIENVVIASKPKDIETEVNPTETEIDIDINNIDINNYEMCVKILKTSYIYENIMEIQGERPVYEEMKPYLSATALSDNRLCKVINAKIEYKNSDILTKILGIGYSRISVNSLDLENDLRAIFFYYGYLGFAIYIMFLTYFIIKGAIVFFKDKSIIHDKECIALFFLLVLLVLGGEHSGAFLRKSNANIYLTLYLVILYFNLNNYCKKNEIQKKN